MLGLPAGMRSRGRAEEFWHGVRDHFGKPVLLWAREGRFTTAVAMVVTSPGRVGFLYHSPPQASQTDAAVLGEVVRQATRQALAGDAQLVQSMIRASDRAAAEVARTAGYAYLADLVHMEHDLCGLEAVSLPDGVHLAPWSGDEQMLMALLAATYVDSQDCPALAGRRAMGDVLASHRTTGEFSPASWWVATRDAQPVGCLLLNRRVSRPELWDVVYMGVVVSARGKGLGRAMLARAAGYVARQGQAGLALAVDASNGPARRLYETFGFVETCRRACWICLPEGVLRSDCE